VLFERGTSTVTASKWPAAALADRPGTWTSFRLGINPDDLTDADGDGLPDAWEAVNYGTAGWDPVKNADTDGDGQSDQAEFTAGTDPRDPLSRFTANLVGDGGMLTWTLAPCRSYTVSSSTDLLDWTPVARGLTYPNWVIQVDPGKPKLFYRITADFGR
jgi:hypothetical protein